MISDQDLQDFLVLNRLSLTGAKSVHELLLNGMKPAEILRRIREENFLNKRAALEEISSFDPSKEIQTAEKYGARMITFSDEDYPVLLRTIADPPLALYVLGSFAESDRAAAAVVGTRHPSFYGREQTAKFSRGISEKGFTVVSGLAQGIDQAAHEAALKISHGRTIAVLGCGLDIDYPSGSKKLKEKIIERGAIVTEYAFGTSPRAENFPRRNRIITGLSLGVLVVEAHSRSGSLITAHLAADEGREVFAVPGPVDQPGSRGTHHLIKEGAHLAETPEDVIEILAPFVLFQPAVKIPEAVSLLAEVHKETVQTQIPVLDGEEGGLLDLLIEKPLTGDEISVRLTGFTQNLNRTLTLLELKGRVRRDYDGRFALTSVR